MPRQESIQFQTWKCHFKLGYITTMYTPIETTHDQIDNTHAELSIELGELKAQFDDAMRSGNQFENARTLYHQINELSNRLNALNWEQK